MGFLVGSSGFSARGALATAALVAACGSADTEGLFSSGGADSGESASGGATAGGGAASRGGSDLASTGATPPVPTSTSGAGAGGAGASAATDGGSFALDGSAGIDPSLLPPGLSHLADCSLTGTWATFIRVPVSWPATPFVLLGGEGEIFQWNLSQRRQIGSLETEEDSVPCGIYLPDLRADVLQTYQQYGIRFPDVVFDLGLVPPVTFRSRATIGSQLTYETDVIATLVGIDMDNPATSPWPGPSYSPADHDQDGNPGVTVLPVEESGYNFPPVGLPPLPFVDLPRARRIHIITRSVAQLDGVIATCDELGGNVNIQTIAGVPGINSTVIGCVKLDGTDCSPSESQFINDNRPQFAPTGPGSYTSVRLDDGATCADARARFQIPQ